MLNTLLLIELFVILKQVLIRKERPNFQAWCGILFGPQTVCSCSWALARPLYASMRLPEVWCAVNAIFMPGAVWCGYRLNNAPVHTRHFMADNIPSGALVGFYIPQGGFPVPWTVFKCLFRAWCGLVRPGVVWCSILVY